MRSRYSKWSPIALLKEKGQWPPYEPDTEGWFSYLKELKDILREGLIIGGDRITPEHFAYLNLCHIGISNDKYGGSKVPTLPYYSDINREFFDTYEDIKKTGENLLGLKTRDKGWTYQVASLALFRTHFVDFSETLVLFPGGTSEAKANFTKAFQMSKDELIYDFRWPELKSNPEGKYISKFNFGVEYELMKKDPTTGKVVGTGITKKGGPQSWLTNIVVTDPSVVRSGRCQLIIIEEMGELGIEGNKWTSKDVIGVAMANIKEGNKKLGPIVAGGTSNQFKEGFASFKDLWLNPGQYNFRKLWIPSTKFYMPFVNLQTGESDEEAAKKEILKEREAKKGKQLLIHKQEHALTEDEALFEGIHSIYDVVKCNKQINRVLTDNKILKALQRGNFYAKKTQGGIADVVFEPEQSGRFLFFEGAQPSLKYPIVIATDSYKYTKSVESDSLGAIIGYKGFQGVNKPGDYPVLLYHARPESKETFFMDGLLATIFYDTQNLVEYTDEDIITFYKTHNAQKYLKKRPSIKESKWSKADNIYGVLPTQHNKNVAAEYAVEKFIANWQDIVFVDLLREMIIFGEKNTDLVDAYHWAVLASVDNVRIFDEYKKPAAPKTFAPEWVKDKMGNLKYVSNQQEAMRMGLIRPESQPVPDKINMLKHGR